MDASLPGRLWTHAETAQFLSLTEMSLHAMNSRGRGPRSFKVGRCRRYLPADVIAWLDARASMPHAGAAS